MSGIGAVLMIVAACLGVVFAILAMIYILVPLVKGVGWLITAVFKGIGWVVMHLLEYIGGTIADVLRFVGSLLAMIVLAPLAPLNVIIGRWSAAGHFADSVKRECKVAVLCLYRVVLQRPLKLLYLHGILEGLEQRVPEAFAATPTRDTPSSRTGQYDGYTIVGSLRGGGSGGKLYIAEPDSRKRVKFNMPDRVVIKSFAISDGSSLPQIVRESRALEAAKQLGLVLEHGMDNHRFWYVMPYLPGDHLGVLTRQMHGESGDNGLTRRHLRDLMVYGRDLLETLTRYHDGGLWHKDVKPENIIINDGRAHLVDLGLVTPLRSAMTLTTHGTEYFRDPEMVRQALRGVKVHQVNGAKFDIYAAGAVLYFVLENTFPAHGGLSRFSKRSPEALRWIVRRAMAEYNKRYESVDMMLADLDVVMRANDPFAVKPVDLPSMSGGEVDYDRRDYEQPEVIGVAAAGSPRPKSADQDQPRAFGFGVEFGRKGVRVGKLHSDGSLGGGEAKPSKSVGAPPVLHVTNWWTGRYELQPQATSHASAGQARQFREAAHDFHRESEDLRDKVRSGVMSARQAARVQIKSARERAKAMRQRANDRRKSIYSSPPLRAKAERQPSLALIGITTVVLLAVIGAGLGTFWVVEANRANEFISGQSQPTSVFPDRDLLGRAPVILINEHSRPEKRSVQREIERLLKKHSEYDVVLTDNRATPLIASLYHAWQEDPTRDQAADVALEDALELYNYYGVLYVGERDNGDVTSQLVYSTREGAEKRRRGSHATLHAAASGVKLPVLLVNDHPAKLNVEIAQRVNDIISIYETEGYRVVTDDAVEPSVRAALPAGPLNEFTRAPERVTRVLNENGYAGVLRITVGESDRMVRATHMFVDETVIEAEASDTVEQVEQSQVDTEVDSVSLRFSDDDAHCMHADRQSATLYNKAA